MNLEEFTYYRIGMEKNSSAKAVNAIVKANNWTGKDKFKIFFGGKVKSKSLLGKIKNYFGITAAKDRSLLRKNMLHSMLIPKFISKISPELQKANAIAKANNWTKKDMVDIYLGKDIKSKKIPSKIRSLSENIKDYFAINDHRDRALLREYMEPSMHSIFSPFNIGKLL